ncbi:MAG: nucleoside deaminase [Deltaproteobacteria bacterium]|nr:nucleoside deaminase [Deltaproteobacteria bacterium]
MNEQNDQRFLGDGGQGAHDPSRRLWLKQAIGLSFAGTVGLGLFESAWAEQQKAAGASFNEEEAKKFMTRALELARKGMESGAGGPFAGVIVKDGKIVGEAWNHVIANQDPTAHGEVMAIRDACKKANTLSLQGCDLYTTGEPCPMCLSAAYWAQISRIFYGFSVQDATAIDFQDEFQFNEFKKPIAQRKIPEIQVMRKEAVELTKNFAARPDRVRY